jgi:hypothetical protein
MLNPSTADEKHNDPTVAKCIRLSRRWEFSALVVVNIFALRSTDPKALYKHPDPIGPKNDEHILQEAMAADLVLCAWGAHGSLCPKAPPAAEYFPRGARVLHLLRERGITPHALRVTAGPPHHPLYLPETLTPFPMLEKTP